MHLILALSLALGVCSAAPGQQQHQQPSAPPPAGSDAQAADADKHPQDEHKPEATPPDQERKPDRMFGVLPNYTSVDNAADAPPVNTRQTMVMAAYSSFDPYVFPFVGVVAGVAQATNQESSWGGGWSGYAKRYAMAFSDNTIGNFMTTAVLPAALRQDPRYFVLRQGSVFHRIGYAASRSVVTRGRTGGREFNLSEIGGNSIAATVANAYHPVEDRTAENTMVRIGSQIMWDTLSNEMKEFWPDIRDRLHHRGN
jgi:hypothetical protein